MSASAAPDDDEDAHRGGKGTDELGKNERTESGEQDMSGADPVGPRTRIHGREREGDEWRPGARPEEGPTVELADDRRQDRHDRAILEGGEGDQRDDADNDGEVFAGEQAVGGGAWGPRGHVEHCSTSSALEVNSIAWKGAPGGPADDRRRRASIGA